MNYQQATLPAGAEFAAVTPDMTETTILPPILKKHLAPRGKYGVLRVSRGNLRFQWEDTGETFDTDPGHPIIIFPERFHHVILTGPVTFRIEFYRVPNAAMPKSDDREAVRPGEKFL